MKNTGVLSDLLKTCQSCHTQFFPSHGKQIYCSQCQNSGYKRRKVRRKVIDWCMGFWGRDEKL